MGTDEIIQLAKKNPNDYILIDQHNDISSQAIWDWNIVASALREHKRIIQVVKSPTTLEDITDLEPFSLRPFEAGPLPYLHIAKLDEIASAFPHAIVSFDSHLERSYRKLHLGATIVSNYLGQNIAFGKKSDCNSIDMLLSVFSNDQISKSFAYDDRFIQNFNGNYVDLAENKREKKTRKYIDSTYAESHLGSAILQGASGIFVGLEVLNAFEFNLLTAYVASATSFLGLLSAGITAYWSSRDKKEKKQNIITSLADFYSEMGISLYRTNLQQIHQFTFPKSNSQIADELLEGIGLKVRDFANPNEDLKYSDVMKD